MVDNRTRERLTGAAILVALIVLLVPELLSRPHRVGPRESAAVDEAPVRSYRLSLGDSQQSASPVTPVAPTTPAVAPPPAATPTTPTTRVTSNDSRAASPPGDGPARAADVRPVPAGSALPERAGATERPAVTDRAPVPERPPNVSNPRKAASALKANRAARGEKAAPTERASGDWAVQVGSFGSRENADRLVHSLKLKGYGAFVTESSSGGRKWYRVRVGPERNRAAADATAARLRAAGLRGAVAQTR